MVNGELHIFIFIFFLAIYHSLFTINPSLVKDHVFRDGQGFADMGDERFLSL